MSSMAIIQDFLAQKRIAVVGVSHDPKDFSRGLLRTLRERGYDAVAVNPALESVDDAPCFAQPRRHYSASGWRAADDLARGHRRGGAGNARSWEFRGSGCIGPEATERSARRRSSSAKNTESRWFRASVRTCFFPESRWFHRSARIHQEDFGAYPSYAVARSMDWNDELRLRDQRDVVQPPAPVQARRGLNSGAGFGFRGTLSEC